MNKININWTVDNNMCLIIVKRHTQILDKRDSFIGLARSFIIPTSKIPINFVNNLLDNNDNKMVNDNHSQMLFNNNC